TSSLRASKYFSKRARRPSKSVTLPPSRPYLIASTSFSGRPCPPEVANEGQNAVIILGNSL
ncbi:MAG: hypothetical protein WBK69_00100, partial [bacterium]